jgi:transposase
MIDVEQYAKIRSLFFAEHWKVGTIATELGVHHDTVNAAIERERFAPPKLRVWPSLLDPYKVLIADTLERYPRLRSTRLYEMLQERGYPGSAVQVRRYVRTMRPTAHAEAYLRRRTLPGEQAQVDWGCFGQLRVGHALRSLSLFVMVLSYSRAIFARFTLDQTLESFLRGHVSAFAALGGVPRVILYDNLKSVVLERQGDHVRFHPHLLDCAGHYHFMPRPCAPYRGNEKGKVERTIQYLRHAFFEARRFASLDDLNAQLADWIERVAHSRRVPTDPDRTLVRDAWTAEQPRLLPLPAHAFPCDHCRPVISGKTPYVRFDLNDYSLPHDRVRQALTLVATETAVRLLAGDGTVVATHARSYDRGQLIEDPAHLDGLASMKRRGRELRGRDRLRQSCPHVDDFLEALCQRGEPLANHTRQLNQLLDRYGAAALESALVDALARGAVAAASVAHVLDQRARALHLAPALDVILPDDPRVRDLRLTPHELGPYDALGALPAPAPVTQEDSHD